MKIGCFGKLPIYKDFLKYNASSRDFFLMDQWFQKGIYLSRQKWGLTWEDKFKNSSPYKFIYQPENSHKSLTGIFIPGQDKGGRKFPFIIFTENGQIECKKMANYTQYMESDFLIEAEQYIKRDWKGLDSVTFINQFKNWAPKRKSISESPDHSLSLKSCFTFWENIFGDFNDIRKYLLIQNIIDSFRPFRTVKPSKSFTGVKIPLSSIGDGGSSSIISFWVQYILKLSGINSTPISLFWNNKTEESGQPFLYLFLREPNPKIFLNLINPHEDMENAPGHMAKLRLAKIDEIMNKMDQRVRALLDKGDLNLLELLTSL